MNVMKLAMLGSALSIIPSVADAALVASLGGGDGPFLELSESGLNGGAVATLVGGTVYEDDQPFADIPAGQIFGDKFLATGPLAGQPATLIFTSSVAYLSFLWGSPDTYNVMTLVTNEGLYTFSASSLGFSVTDGDQGFSQYVQFAASAGEMINSVSFTNVPAIDAFETANFSISVVPEPSSWALMLAGFGMVGYVMRRRRAVIALA